MPYRAFVDNVPAEPKHPVGFFMKSSGPSWQTSGSPYDSRGPFSQRLSLQSVISVEESLLSYASCDMLQ